MFLEERHQKILEMLDRDGRVAVPHLAKEFAVTEDCIRKDLKQLCAEGRCRRVYGGATKMEAPAVRDVNERIGLFAAEKQVIAKKAFGLIEPGQTIFLDISTTNLRIAQLLASEGVACTVVSPMVDVLRAVAATPGIAGICPGGTMHPSLNGFVGALAVDAMDRFRFEVAFLGAYGIDAEAREVTTYDVDDGLVKAAAIERAARSYLVSELRKVGAFGTYRYASLEDFDALICDDATAADADLVRSAGLEVL